MLRSVHLLLVAGACFAGQSSGVKADPSSPATLIAGPDQAIESQLLAGGVSLNGIGPILGLGGSLKNLFEGRTQAFGAYAFGRVRGGGFLLTDIPVGIPQTSLSVFHASVLEGSLLTSYTRGLKEDRPYRQKFDGRGSGLFLNFKGCTGRLKVSAGLVQTVAGFAGYETTGGREVQLPDSSLSEVSATNILLKTSWDQKPAEYTEAPSWGGSLNIRMDTGRSGQADQLITGLSLKSRTPMGPYSYLRAGIKYADAVVLKREKKYENKRGVLKALKTDCSSLNGTDRQDCEALNGDLASYIAANNRYGTAGHLGGSTGLRSYRELQFRAAMLRTASVEWALRISDLIPGLFTDRSARLELVPFADLGYAADRQSRLFKKYVHTAGISLRLYKGSFPVRLSFAGGSGKKIWFLAVGPSI